MFDPFGLNNHINSMINSMMMDPFMPMQQRRQQQQQQQGANGSTSGGGNGQLRPFDPFGTSSALSPFDFHHRVASNPFSLMHQMMGNMDGMLRGGHDPFSAVIHADPNSEVYSSSSMITYSSSGGEGGRPKVFQQSKQMRAGPGGVKETREIVRDSERGVEQMSIGHHIGEKSHVIERKRNRNGEIEESVNLENLDDEELQEFNNEFEKRVGTHFRTSQHGSHQHRQHHHLNNNHPLPIEHSSNKDKSERKSSKSRH